jgi:rhizosphere induced protein
MAGTIYSLVFVNGSENTWDAAVYQQDPDLGVPDVQSLAWFKKTAASTTNITFSWTVDYSFVWSETGVLVPGVKFDASQNWPADLSTQNQVTLTKSPAYTFSNQMQGPKAGTLYVNQDGTIPSKMASVGIGMSGAGVYAVQAQPNIQLTFTPHPKYWITFGQFAQGQVLDIGQVTGQAASIEFPDNIYSLTAILGANNKWTVKSTAAVNAAFLEARKTNKDAIWGLI